MSEKRCRRTIYIQNEEDIFREELDKALNSVQNGKAAGKDNIFIEIIKFALCDPVIEEIFILTKQMYSTGQIPKDFLILLPYSGNLTLLL